MISLPLAVGAFVAGILMFLAPCTLPIVPGYLAFVGGGQGKVVRNALFFVVGFSIVFIILGSMAGLFGLIVGSWRYALARAGGALVVLFGLAMLGVRIPYLSGERHARLPHLSVGTPQSSALLGALFALGWSPCIGPILGTILLVASSSSTALSGALLLALFSLGLGIPFLLVALLMERAQAALGALSGLSRALSVLGGAFLVALGILMMLGQTGLLVSWGFGALDFIGYDRLQGYL